MIPIPPSIIPGDGVGSGDEIGTGEIASQPFCFMFQPLTLRSTQKGGLLAFNLFQPEGVIGRRNIHQPFFFILIILLMSNLSSLVDVVLHPEIPYFDTEHLIVGGVTGLVSCILLGLLVFYTRLIERAVKRINRLESILPICSSCKMIRTPGSDPKNQESWQSIESYIANKTATRFTHGICPECAAVLYPQLK